MAKSPDENYSQLHHLFNITRLNTHTHTHCYNLTLLHRNRLEIGSMLICKYDYMISDYHRNANVS